MKMKLVYLLGIALALNASNALHAEDNNSDQPHHPRAGEGPGRERMGEFLKQLGLKPEDLKDLPQDERRAKLQDAVQKKKAELEKKKADGTLTDDDKELLKRLEHFGNGPGGASGPGEARREQMEKMAKDLGLNVEEMKNLSPEARRAKFKDAAQKKMAELQKREQDGTITADEKDLLHRMQQFRERMQNRREGTGKPDDQK